MNNDTKFVIALALWIPITVIAVRVDAPKQVQVFDIQTHTIADIKSDLKCDGNERTDCSWYLNEACEKSGLHFRVISYKLEDVITSNPTMGYSPSSKFTTHYEGVCQ
jgi:hypothetical protein